jgi:hypothetical protein
MTILPPAGRDLRLDLFRGIANWAIFLDHIPNNIVNWLTMRNYGFSDAADLFVFISGYTAAFVYARIMLEWGFVAGATRLLKRAWQIYVAHVFLLAIYLAEIGYLGQTYGNPEFANEFNITGFLRAPAATIYEGLLLRFKPVNMDVLPLYIVLMLAFPPILWGMLRRPNLTLLGSVLLYFAARLFAWNLPGYPSGAWYFNPFTWQLPFMFGAWFALGGRLAMAAADALTRRGGGRHCLSQFRAGHDDGRAIPRIWTVAAGVALRDLQSGQDQSSFLSVHPFGRAGAAGGAFPAARLARSHVAGLAAGNRVRTIFALGLLLRNLFVLRCAFRLGRSLGSTVDASAREPHGSRLDDDACLVPVLVEAHRSTPAPMDGATACVERRLAPASQS